MPGTEKQTNSGINETSNQETIVPEILATLVLYLLGLMVAAILGAGPLVTWSILGGPLSFIVARFVIAYLVS